MKTRELFYLIMIIFLYSCNENEERFTEDVIPMTRTIVDENRESISNPDLIWNWENTSKILLNIEKMTSGKYVVTPWMDGSSSPLPETFRKDIKKEDGWKMLFHTFKKTGVSEKTNYMCFYNQFTGFVKIFYYYEESEKHQGVQWYIKTNQGIKTKLLDEPTYLSRLESAPATNDMLLFSNLNDVPTTGIGQGWNGFEFQVPRYCSDLTSMDFKIGAYEKQITDYNLLGKEFLETLGTITTTTESSSGISKALANIAGLEAKKFIDKLGKNVFGEKVILGQSIKGLISSIPGSSYISLFKSGLDVIFGKSTTTSTSDVKLTTTGTVEINGTSSTITTTGIPTLNFNLHEVLNPAATRSSLVTASTSNHYLGVWTLKKNPKVYYERLTMIQEPYTGGISVDGKQIELKGGAPLPKIAHYDLEPVINPDLVPYIKDYSFSVKFVICNHLDGESQYVEDIDDAILLVNDTTYLYSDANITLKEPKTRLYSVAHMIDKEYCNNLSTKACWYDWGNIIDGRLLAIVSLNMRCSCQGKDTEIYQSGVYDVDYGIDETLLQPETVHFPPSSFVVNYGYPHTMGWKWRRNTD